MSRVGLCRLRRSCYLPDGHRGTNCMADRAAALTYLRKLRDNAHRACVAFDRQIADVEAAR